jgi:hypothetical protein
MSRNTTLIVLILLAAFSRLVPHEPNFAPIAGMALFGAANFRNRWLAFAVPLAAMFLSDLALGWAVHMGVYSGWMANTKGLHSGSIVIYATFTAIAAMGFVLRRNRSIPLLAGTTLAGSLVFFVITNFAVWVGGDGDLYPHTLDGLVTCYVQAIPFFRNTLAGDVFYVAVLFGSFALVERFYPSLRPALAPATASND